MGLDVGDPVLGGQDRRGSLLARAAWSFLAQTVSSGSNFLLSVLILAVASASEFAVYALCLTTYAFVLQLTRATIGVPVALLHSDSAGGGDHDEQRAAVGANVAVGILAGALIVAASAFASQGRAQLIVLGISLPFLLWQDAIRYVCFARSCPSVAAGADGLWVAVQVIGSAALLAAGKASALTLLGVWAGGGTVSAWYLGIRLRLAPRLRAAGRWGARHGALCSRLLAEFLVSAGSHYSVYYGLAIVAGAGQLGRLKAAQTLLGPVVVLLQGGALLGVPESVRAAHDPALLRRISGRLSGVLAGGSLACGVVIFAVLPRLGPAVFPHAWATARPLIPMLTLFCGALGLSTGATAALRALGDTPWLLRVRARSAAVLLLLGVAASATFQAGGALASVTVVEGAVAVLAWRRLRRVTTGGPTTIAPDDCREGSARWSGRPVPWPAEAGPHSLRPGGGVSLPDGVGGLGPDSGDDAGTPSPGPGTRTDHA